MSKDDLVKLVQEKAGEAEAFYIKNGPRKREQEEFYKTGVSVVEMNVRQLESWLDGELDLDGESCLGEYLELPKEQRREIWEASGFHFGIYGYEEHDAEFYWEHEED